MDRLDRAITRLASKQTVHTVVRNLECLRGTSTLIAFGLAVEIGDWERFTGRGIGVRPHAGAHPSQGDPRQRH